VLAELTALELRRLSWARTRTAVAALAGPFAEHDLLTYSSAIAFQVLYAVVPLAMLGLASLGVLGLQSVYTGHVAPTLHHDLSHAAFGIADRTARRVMITHRGFWLTIGLAVTVWGVSAAIRATMTPLNAIYGRKETRSWRNRLLLSIGVAVLVIVSIFAALGIVFGAKLLHPSEIWLRITIDVGRWVAVAALVLLAIAAILRLVPDRKLPPRWVSIGSCLAAGCWIVATIGFAAYVSSVSYSSFYGALATVVLLLVYLHLAAIALLLGVVADQELKKLVERREAQLDARPRRSRATRRRSARSRQPARRG
jgi:membrane protein